MASSFLVVQEAPKDPLEGAIAQLEFVESLLAQGSLGDIEGLLLELEAAVSPLLSASTVNQREFLGRVARMLAGLEGALAGPCRVRMMTSISQSFFSLGKSSHGLAFATSALNTARSINDKHLERKTLNTLAVLSNDSGLPAAGLEHGVNAACLAKELDDAIGFCASLANVTTSLKCLGNYRETINLSMRVVELSKVNPILKNVRCQALANMSMAAYALRQYPLSVQSANQSINENFAPSSMSDVINLVAALGASVKTLVAMKRPLEAKKKLDQLMQVSEASRLPRAEISVKISAAICQILDGDTHVGFTTLLNTLSESACSPGLYVDNLEALIRGYDSVGETESVAKYSCQLIEYVMNGHVRSIALQLGRIDEKMVTLQPGKEDAQTLVRAVHKGRIEHKSTEIDSSAESVQQMFERFAVSAEWIEDSTGRHAYRVGAMAGFIAAELGYGQKYCDEIDCAARLHDIGKLSVRDAVLNKPGPLTPAERKEMQKHTIEGVRLLNAAKQATTLSHEIALSHHERWDGTGYPLGLKGSAIPESARIASVSDVFDALSHARVYKKAWAIEDCVNEILVQSGKMFEPRVVQAFLRVISHLRSKYGDENVSEALTPSKPSAFLVSNDRVKGLINGLPSPWTFDHTRDVKMGRAVD